MPCNVKRDGITCGKPTHIVGKNGLEMCEKCSGGVAAMLADAGMLPNQREENK